MKKQKETLINCKQELAWSSRKKQICVEYDKSMWPGAILMEYVSKTSKGMLQQTKTLNSFLGKHIIVKSMPWSCNALSYLHTKGILHNDLHSDNILICPSSYTPVIIDFGKATLLENPVVYYIQPGSIENTKYNRYHCHLAH